MIKRLVPVIILLFISAHNFAQTTLADSSTHFIAAFNAEQMLEKMGFDNLMKTLFENKQFDKKNTPEAVGQKTTIRKALAALYGAGINLNKKIWLVINQKNKPYSSQEIFSYNNYETPMRLVIMPVANKQVVQENILKLIAAEKKTDSIQFVNSNGVLWMQHKKSVILISNNEMIVTSLPEKSGSYNHPLYYYGTTIKSDTVVTPKTKTWAADESIEMTEKPVIIEIDRVQTDGKIKRAFTYKEEKNGVRFTPPKVVADEEIKVDSAAAVMDTAAVAIDPVPSFSDAASDTATAKQDTLTRGEYLNDSTYITHYYIPFTDAEKDSLQTIYQQEKDLQLQKQAIEFVKYYQTYLPKEDNAVVNKLSTDTADMVFYSATGGASPYSFFGSRMLGVGPARLLNNQAATITAINFTNGQVTMASTYINSNDTAANLFSQLYKPITNFWPAALGSPVLGNMQCNVNVSKLLVFIKNAAGNGDKVEREIKREGIDLDELQKAFTGQVSAAIHTGVNKYGKKQPRLLIALQVNNAAAAVGFMNRIGSKKTKSVNSYRFDENGKYLLFDTDGKNGLLKQAVATVQKMPPPVAGTVATANLNVKAMMLAFTKDSKKNNAEYKQAQQFFSTINVTASTNTAGNFTTVLTAGMGNPKTNALYNLLQMINGGSNGTGLPNFLKGIR